MKKSIYIIYLLLLIGHSAVFGQQVSYQIDSSITTTASYTARDYIRLLPGFSFDPAGGKTLYLGIDEHILDTANYQSKQQIPNPNRNLNTSYAVGSISGEASVSPTGAAMYQIPIDVMPGTGGIQPNISIAYHSQSGNGVVGYGWNLNALSAITRTGSTLYHDDTIKVPDLTSSDNLMLDGQRLMRASGSNLAASSTYKTEIESYQEITYKSQNGYLSFEVKNTEGWTLQYGSSADSYIKPAGSATPYVWLLKRVTDANGNYMTYTYENNVATGEYRLKQIDYTGNAAANINPYNKIEFFYEIRKDSTTRYITDKALFTDRAIKQSLILKRIKCSTGGSTIREYKFNYYYDDYLSKLTEVEVYGQDGIRYNSTVVDWGDYNLGNVVKQGVENQNPRSPSDNATPIYADFNGNGKTSFITYYYDPTLSSRNDSALLYVSNKTVLGDITFALHSKIPLSGKFVELIPADLNGDGLMDVIHVKKDPNDSGYYYTYYIYDGTTFTATHTINSASAPDEVMVGDFNGDGKDEILFRSEDKLYNEIGTGTSFTGITNWGQSRISSGWLSGITEKVKVSRRLIDFNGNGKANIVIMDALGFRVYELNDVGNAFDQLYFGNDLQCITTGSYKEPLFDDFNGDGKTDILVCKTSATPNEYYLLYSTGTGFEKKMLPNLNVPGKWFAADFNRDGRSDIVYSTANGSLTIGLFNGETFLTESHNSDFLNGVDLNNKWKDLYFSDFDGDGLPELVYSGYNDKYIVKSFINKHNLFVKAIVNGLNQQDIFTYQPITNNSYYETSSTPVTYPVTHFRQPLYVVSSWKQQRGTIADTVSYYYIYKGAKIHKYGKGFLGFEEVSVANLLHNRRTTTQYTYNSYYHIYPTQQTVATLTGDSISHTVFDRWYYDSSIPKVIFPYLRKQTTEDKLTGISAIVNYVYNASDHGHPSTMTQTQGNLTTQTLYTWEAKGGSAYKNRLTQQQTTQQGFGAPFTQIQTFAYNAQANLTQQVDFYGNAKAVTTTYSNYDLFGNPKTVTTAAANCPTITTSDLYDTTGRFITRHTDELGNHSYAQYDPKTGVLLEQTDIAGTTTTYQYDGFQRLTQAESPFDKLTYATVWNISGANLYRTNTTSLVTGTQSIWYNTAGQELRTQTPGFSGMVVTENTYNAKGQLYHSHLPEYGNSSPIYVQYAYDTYGRLLSETHLGRTTSYAYNGLTTTVTAPNGTTRSTTLDLSGLVVSATDEANQAVTYTYNSQGKPLTITAAGDVTHITYDDRGFQQSLQDVNMANPIQYVYDAYGQITSQTNEHGQTTTYQYDVAGRITQQTAPERTLTYQYVPSGNGVGQIQSISENNNVVRSYAYTPLGQVASIAEKIDNADYTTSYAYNNYGQMTEKQSPSGMRIGYQYNSSGLLTTMRNADNNALLWQADGINAMGQMTGSTLGNGLQRVLGYNVYNLLYRIELKNGNTVVDHVDYDFNTVTGNVTSRFDISNNRNEFFGYDALHRLDTIRVNNNIVNRITYSPNGNINTKFDVGTYQYANNSHAVSGISNPVSGYNPPAFTLSSTSYNRPLSLIQQGSPIKKLDFQYNADDQRKKTLYYENNVLEKTMYYVGSYEKEVIEGGDTNEYDYIYSPEGLSAIAVKTGGVRTLYYTHIDHLGSLRLVTTQAKAIQSRYHYDAWGIITVIAGPSITNRGFTGHEHLPEFGFINMNARLYDPVLGRFLAMDPFVQMPDYTQAFNRYAYAMNNPLIYTDPSGEFIWIFPTIGWSKQDGLNVGLNVVVGIPGVFSVQGGVGYNFKSNDTYFYVGASAMFNTVSMSYSSQSGWSVGYSFGLSPHTGLPISTNFTSMGVNYNITHDSWSGNVSAWSIDRSGWRFNPSFSVMIYPEHTTNLVRGQGFRSNENVFQNFVSKEQQQKALDYFGFKGTYNPEKTGGRPAVTDPKTGEIFYGDYPFESNFDRLAFIGYHEMKHRRNVLSGKYEGMKIDLKIAGMEEWETYLYSYKNQGLYRRHGFDLVSRINSYGFQGEIYGMYVTPDGNYSTSFTPKWWQWIYRIPRKW